MPREKQPPCERCKVNSRNKGERFCWGCRDKVLRQVRESSDYPPLDKYEKRINLGER